MEDLGIRRVVVHWRRRRPPTWPTAMPGPAAVRASAWRNVSARSNLAAGLRDANRQQPRSSPSPGARRPARATGRPIKRRVEDFGALRPGDQVQRRRRRRRAPAGRLLRQAFREGHLRLPGPGASADRRTACARSPEGLTDLDTDRRGAFHQGAGLPAGSRSRGGDPRGCARGSVPGQASRHRRRRRRDLLRRRGGGAGAGGGAEHSGSPPR